MVAPIGVIIFGIVLVIPSWRIFKQTGMSPAWSLFVFLPGIGLLVIYLLLAFAPWSALDRRPSVPDSVEPP